jgi:hypothetical protein
VSEDVIAAVLLLHERSVEEIIPQLSPAELEKVIELVGRSPRLYPRGILEALDQHRSLMASALTPQSRPAERAQRVESGLTFWSKGYYPAGILFGAASRAAKQRK